eukprot:m.129392 g.129392  ORF g.129392 m.129392 type:complete len:62 (+) comp37976_c0_seq35:1319-1504(+)
MFSKRDSSLVWSKTQALDLALENMQRLTSLKATPDASWKLVSSDNGVRQQTVLHLRLVAVS